MNWIVFSFIVFMVLLAIDHTYHQCKCLWRQHCRPVKHVSMTREEFVRKLDMELLEESNAIRRHLGLKERPLLDKDTPICKRSIPKDPKVEVKDGKIYLAGTRRQLMTIADVLSIV